jgi:hypothetical protein
MLLGSVAAALVLLFIGPLLLGAAPAFADGPHHMGGQMHVNHGNVGNFPMGGHFRGRDPDHDGDRDFPRFNHFRNFNNCCAFNHFNGCCFANTYAVAVPYVYPVAYAVPYPNYYWMNYGPGWNYGMPAYQVQQTCNSYNSAYGANPAAYNASVAGVCISISVSGNTVSIQVTP